MICVGYIPTLVCRDRFWVMSGIFITVLGAHFRGEAFKKNGRRPSKSTLWLMIVMLGGAVWGSTFLIGRPSLLAALSLTVAGTCFVIGMREQQALSSSAPAAADRSTEMNFPKFMRQLARLCHLPSLAVAYRAAGELDSHHYWCGVRKIKSDISIGELDAFHIGSCTKSMTSSLAALLVERSELRWEITIAETFKDLSVHSDLANVTLQQLLCHQGGVIGHLPDNLWRPLFTSTDSPTEERRRIVAWVIGQAPYVPVGEYQYSNIGYVIAGAMMETIKGASWEELIKTYLFQPLQMASAGFGVPASPDILDNPWGHRRKKWLRLEPIGPGPFADNPPAIGPAGTVHCNMRDLLKFAESHCYSSGDTSSSFFKRDTLAKLHSEAGYSFGWVTKMAPWARGKETLIHVGSNRSFTALVCVVPEMGFSFVAATNCGGALAQRACHKALERIAESYFGV